MPIYLGATKLKGGNNLIRVFVGAQKVYDAYTAIRRTVNEPIPVTTQNINDSTRYKYTTHTVPGAAGNNSVVYEDRYKYGVLYQTVKISTTQTQAMVPTKVYIGTKTAISVSVYYEAGVTNLSWDGEEWIKKARYTVSRSWPNEWIGKVGTFVDRDGRTVSFTMGAGTTTFDANIPHKTKWVTYTHILTVS